MAITVQNYNNFWEDVGKGVINLYTDTFKIMLVKDYTFVATHDEKTDIDALTVELATANGYTAGGQALTGITWGYDVGNSNTKWDADNLNWTAVTGAIGPANGAILFSDTSTGKKLCSYINFGQDETAGVDTDFKITFNAAGILTVTAA